MSTTLELESGLLAEFEGDLTERNLERLLERMFDLCHLAARAPELEVRFNHMPEMDSLVQRLGREIQRDLSLPTQEVRGTTNVFIASELFRVGGHTRNLSDLTKNSRHRNVVILTDVFDNYSQGLYELGEITQWLNASVIVLPKMSLIDKTQNLMMIISSLDVHSIGILAHHEDVVAYASCNDLLKVPQVFIHHADHNPALGATIRHYDHVDLWPGNQAMCEEAGYVSTKYASLTGECNFQEPRDNTPVITSTAGTFNKFAVDGPLNYAEIIGGILSEETGKHVHIGNIPPDYLAHLRANLQDRGIDPTRFVYLGNVPDVQAALIQNEVGVYIGSAPIGGSSIYVEVLGLGMPVLHYEGADNERRVIAKYNDTNTYGDHPRWSTVAELRKLLRELNIEQECLRSRRVFTERYATAGLRELAAEFF